MTTSVPFLVFPGVAGNFIETADVNEMNADDAHIQQSVGAWTAGGTDITTIVQSTRLTPLFGGFHADGAIRSGTWIGNLYHAEPSTPTVGIPVLGNTEYTFSMGIAFEDQSKVGPLFALRLNWYDSGGGFISDTVGSQITPTTSLVRYSVTGTSPSNAAFVLCRLVLDFVSAAGGELLAWDAGVLRKGSDATFVPSLRIVGDLDVRIDASDQWASATGTERIFGRYLNSGAFSFSVVKYGTGNIALDTRVVSVGSQFAGFASGAADGVRSLIRFTRVASSGTVEYFLDGVSQGTAATASGGPEQEPGVSLAAGGRSDGSTEPWGGSLWSAVLLDGIDGPVVATCQAVDAATATVT